MNRFTKAKEIKEAEPQEPMRHYTDESPDIPPSMRFFRFEVTAYWLLPILIFCAILLGGIFVAFKLDVFSPRADGDSRPLPYYNASGEILVPELFDSYLTSIGGREALQSVRSIRYKGRLVEPGGEIDFQILVSSPGKGMIITSPGKDYRQKIILNGDTAWQEVELGEGQVKIVPLDQTDTEALAWSLRIHNTFRSLALDEDEVREGFSARKIDFQDKPCFELSKRMPDGSEFLAVLDRESLYLLKMEETVRSADGKERLQAVYGEHRTVSGIVLAFETKTYKDGNLYNESYLDYVEINPGLVSSLFEIPEEF